MARTIFERYGGFAKISRVVSDFYENMLDEPIVAKYFDNVDMRRLMDHQTKFIAQLTGGPVSYSDEALQRVHAHLSIDNTAFNAMARILCETLEDFDFAQDDVDAIRAEIAVRRHLIVTIE
ncbi:MAG: group 1 truncated hemoglobin [Alphaproteobacteria bacterium]|nr:group 1 truncated hemoglobin [Alphaproteobacteria bacterium]